MTGKTRKKHATFKLVLGVVSLLIVSIFFVSYYFSNKLKPLLKSELKDLVFNATDSLYRLEFSDLNVSLITKGATLLNVKLIPDTTVFKRLIAERRAPNNIYYIELKKLTIINFQPKQLFKNRKLNVSKVLFENPDVVMVNQQFDFNERSPSYLQKSPYDYISKYLAELNINTIAFTNIRFKYISNAVGKQEMDSVSNLNITLKNWLINKESDNNSDRLYALQDIRIALNNYTYATADSLYRINLEQLYFSSSSGKLNIQSFKVVPRYDEMSFGKLAGYSKERYAIDLSNISLEGINFPLYIRKRELYTTEMTVSNGSVNVFNNNALPSRIKIKNGKFPHQLLQLLRAPLTIRLLNLNNINIAYSEFDRDSGQKGKITFEKTSGTITNITNVARLKKKSPYLFADLTTYMMGKGKLNASFRFNLDGKEGQFAYSGTLGDMDGRVLNKVTMPLGMVQIRRGHVQRLTFNIKANEQKATGKISFFYKDLSVALLKRKDKTNKLVKQGWMSLLANAMVINSDNPDEKGVMIHAPISYQRPATASFFSFIWRTLFSGIKYSVGVTPQKEQQILNKVQQFEQIKIDRDKRKIERSKRRGAKPDRNR
ncbi:MAG: hypothetical protein V4687_10965 [Bacteroidota bacterium]